MKKEFIFIVSFVLLFVGCTTTKSTTPTGFTSLQIIPKQCEAPWQQNEGNSNEERLENYLKTRSIELLTYSQKSTDMMACAACGCPGTILYSITIPEKDKAVLIKQGFTEVVKK
ncbi:hypothetical protein [Aquimarina intermedia]|uniref:Lipoprotein n=1 Tax=Aquimarina intermedia TaxID=350814 RepID=A0A5S5CG02_9FLAO|nr:hypothetical protein [Aquimarina intermedia]TYP77216.1 hypothetical protein BD809_101367 [Aquimarina intermedia]